LLIVTKAAANVPSQNDTVVVERAVRQEDGTL
jgi:hypothetical protein